MKDFKLGVMLESFLLPWREAAACAASVGADGVQIRAVGGEFEPAFMTKEKRRELLEVLSANGLAISALCGDLGKGFGNRELNPGLIEQSKRIVDLAKELGTDIVTTHIGVIPGDRNHERYKIMQEACFELADYADRCQAHFAVETGPETSLTLKGFLDSLGSTGVAVNLDPANLVMVTGDDPVKAVENLKRYIVHTHAKDGRKLMDLDPEIIYGLSESEMLGSPAFIELPLGEGDVPFPAYLEALRAIGYHGYLTIEREVGERPKEDIIKAADYLKGLDSRKGPQSSAQ